MKSTSATWQDTRFWRAVQARMARGESEKSACGAVAAKMPRSYCEYRRLRYGDRPRSAVKPVRDVRVAG